MNFWDSSPGNHCKCILLLIMIVSVVSFSGCNDSLKNLDAELTALQQSIDTSFKKIEMETIEYADKIEDIYRTADQYAENLYQLDTGNGGIFTTYGVAGEQKYYTDIPYNESLLAVLDITVDDTVRRNAAVLIPITDQVIVPIWKGNDNIGGVFFGKHDPYNIFTIAPHYDPVSTLPIGLALFTNFPWYYRAFEKPGQVVWSEDAFISLAGSTSWMLTVIRDVHIHGETEKGVLSVEVWIEELNAKTVDQSTKNIVLLSPSLTILGASSEAVTQLPQLKVLDTFYYTKQLSNNEFIPDEYKLTDSSQHPDIISLAEKIKSGTQEFEQEIEGTRYTFIVKNIDRVNFKIVGFVRN